MGRGKELCKLLKDVRVKIAAENNIDYTPIECTHKGDCRGTCPQCEAELRWIQPRFIPAQYKGRNKDSFFSLPISFRLPDSIANQPKKN